MVGTVSIANHSHAQHRTEMTRFHRIRHELNIDLVFPIKDEVSAWLMCLKAESLFEAGVIDIGEMSTVLERAAAVLDQLPEDAA